MLISLCGGETNVRVPDLLNLKSHFRSNWPHWMYVSILKKRKALLLFEFTLLHCRT